MNIFHTIADKSDFSNIKMSQKVKSGEWQFIVGVVEMQVSVVEMQVNGWHYSERNASAK